MLKKLSLIMIIAGLAMGPAYWIYMVYFTGKVAQTIDLDAMEGGAWGTSVFHLEPDMAPVGLILLASGSFLPTMDDNKPPSDPYTVTLSHGDTPGQPIPVRLAATSVADSNPQFRLRLALLKAPRAGDYRLEISPDRSPQIRLDKLQLEIRSHLLEPDYRVVAAGMALVAFGLIIRLS